MSMSHDQAAALKTEIERDYPSVRCELGEYGGAWVVTVINRRTNEQFGIVNAADWRVRLQNMLGGQPGPIVSGDELVEDRDSLPIDDRGRIVTDRNDLPPLRH